jgi:hypothetical protein
VAGKVAIVAYFAVGPNRDNFAIGEAISNIKTYPLASLTKEDQYSLSKS